MPAICRIPGPPLKAAIQRDHFVAHNFRVAPRRSRRSTAVIHSVTPGIVALATPAEAAFTPFNPGLRKHILQQRAQIRFRRLQRPRAAA